MKTRVELDFKKRTVKCTDIPDGEPPVVGAAPGSAQPMKTADQLKPNYGPAYAAAMYPELAAIFHRHGYALAVHGSLARDLDLIAVPWAETVSDAATVLRDVTTVFALRLIGEPWKKNHGRMAYTLSCGFGACAIDLSFVPNAEIADRSERFGSSTGSPNL